MGLSIVACREGQGADDLMGELSWQKLRVADVEFDKETKDQALQKLTKLEREIRKRVEDILDPHAHLDKAKLLEPSSPRVSVLSRSAVNGQAKHRPNGDQTKKGKKRKE